MKRILGPLETKVWAYTQMRGLRGLRSGDLVRSMLKFTANQEREVLGRMSRRGMLLRVRKGYYLIPEKLPLGGFWTPGEIETLVELMADSATRYQLCGPTVFNLLGFDAQIPNRVYAYNTRWSGNRKVGVVQLCLIKVAPNRLGATRSMKLSEGRVAVAPTRARALVDAIYDWSRFNGIPRGYEWIRRELLAGRVRGGELVDCAIRYGDTGTIRRLGVLLEREGVPPVLLKRLERVLRPTRSTIPWIPSRPKRGTVDRRWGVVVNETSNRAGVTLSPDPNRGGTGASNAPR